MQLLPTIRYTDGDPDTIEVTLHVPADGHRPDQTWHETLTLPNSGWTTDDVVEALTKKYGIPVTRRLPEPQPETAE